MADAAAPRPDAPATARLFTAFWPTPRERAQAAAWSARCRFAPRAAVVAPARLHATLHFLGAVERARIAAVVALLPPPLPRTTLVFDTPQLWHGGTLVLEASAVPPALAALHAELGARLAAGGFAVEARRWRPHLTFARHAGGSRWPADAPALRWRPSRVVLVESVAGPAPHYRVVPVTRA